MRYLAIVLMIFSLGQVCAADEFSGEIKQTMKFLDDNLNELRSLIEVPPFLGTGTNYETIPVETNSEAIAHHQNKANNAYQKLVKHIGKSLASFRELNVNTQMQALKHLYYPFSDDNTAEYQVIVGKDPYAGTTMRKNSVTLLKKVSFDITLLTGILENNPHKEELLESEVVRNLFQALWTPQMRLAYPAQLEPYDDFMFVSTHDIKGVLTVFADKESKAYNANKVKKYFQPIFNAGKGHIILSTIASMNLPFEGLFPILDMFSDENWQKFGKISGASINDANFVLTLVEKKLLEKHPALALKIMNNYFTESTMKTIPAKELRDRVITVRLKVNQAFGQIALSAVRGQPKSTPQ